MLVCSVRVCQTFLVVISASLDYYINASPVNFSRSRSRREPDRKASLNTATEINGRRRFSLAVNGLQVYRQRVTWIQKEDVAVVGQGIFFNTISCRTQAVHR